MKISSKKELNRYSIAVRDFEKAKEYVCAAKKHSFASIEHEALLFAAIVSYYRPFSPNEKTKFPEATPQLFVKDFGSLTEPQIKLHEKCKELRNKALAHSEFELNRTNFDDQTGVFSSAPFSLSSQSFDLGSLEALLIQFIDLCHNKRADFSRECSKQ